MSKTDIQFTEFLKLRRQNNPAAIERIKAMDKLRRNTFEHYANMIDGGGAKNTNPAADTQHLKRR